MIVCSQRRRFSGLWPQVLISLSTISQEQPFFIQALRMASISRRTAFSLKDPLTWAGFGLADRTYLLPIASAARLTSAHDVIETLRRRGILLMISILRSSGSQQP